MRSSAAAGVGGGRETDFNSWISYSCAVAGRNLSTDEWRAVFGDRPYHEACPAG